jgi:hypothetical protein
MAEVSDRLVAAMNEHDIDAAAGLMHEDYRSEQPVRSRRAFPGRSQDARQLEGDDRRDSRFSRGIVSVGSRR